MSSIKNKLAAAAVSFAALAGGAMAQEAEQPLLPDEQATINLVHEFFECVDQKSQPSEDEIAALDSAALDERVIGNLKDEGFTGEELEELAAFLSIVPDDVKRDMAIEPVRRENNATCLIEMSIDEVAEDEKLNAIAEKYGEERIWEELDKLDQQAAPAPSGP